MSPNAKPEAGKVKAEVLKCVKVLLEQRELLRRRLFRTGIRLDELDAQLREKGKNYRQSN
jgi:hypothetical protein